MLGAADLTDWAGEDDLVRAEIRLQPVVRRFAADPGLMRIILGNDIAGRLRGFIKGRDLDVDALRRLLADLIEANSSTSPRPTTADPLPGNI
jgi:hypothetical protein